MDADGLHSSMLPVDLSMQQVLLSYIVLTATLTHYCKTVLQAAVVEIFMLLQKVQHWNSLPSQILLHRYIDSVCKECSSCTVQHAQREVCTG